MRPFTTVCVSGYFDPLHVGHIDYLRNARILGDKLIVILNTDAQRVATHKNHLDETARKVLLESIRYVDEVHFALDTGAHVCDTLRHLRPDIFAKGLSASDEELQVCTECGIQVVTGVGSQLHLQDLLASLR